MSYTLSDNVLARIVQIVQEGFLLGIDVVDLMRQIEVQVSPDGSSLELTDAYAKKITEHHKQLLEDAELLKAAQNAQDNGIKFVIEA
jgi:hypothetical protein